MSNTVSLVVPGEHNFGGKGKYVVSFGQAVQNQGNENKPLCDLVPPSVEDEDYASI